jgi:hypothetical protein
LLILIVSNRSLSYTYLFIEIRLSYVLFIRFLSVLIWNIDHCEVLLDVIPYILLVLNTIILHNIFWRHKILLNVFKCCRVVKNRRQNPVIFILIINNFLIQNLYFFIMLICFAFTIINYDLLINIFMFLR